MRKKRFDFLIISILAALLVIFFWKIIAKQSFFWFDLFWGIFHEEHTWQKLYEVGNFHYGFLLFMGVIHLLGLILLTFSIRLRRFLHSLLRMDGSLLIL